VQQATWLVVLGSVDLEDQEGDRDGEDTVTERRSSGGLGQTGLILRRFLDGVLVRHDRMLALGMRRYGSVLPGQRCPLRHQPGVPVVRPMERQPPATTVTGGQEPAPVILG